ncbi:MAG: Cyclohexa-1,5-dienecarbonyl-CoA hydratase [Candidatus Heimdallarchaeota archaeon LC_3]|nr:MAG: Cyclohexa-1,5-dienecarbonyl-CoA hydratase [Candidatus Heimdallarchaeota archaeon LC_3]
MSYELIHLEKDSNIAKIIFDNGPLNILNIPMMKEINKALTELKSDNSLKALILDHKGKAFSAGVDVGDHMGEKTSIMLKEFHQLCKSIISFESPTIAITRGAALGGGCEIAIACDMILASNKAKFGQPEIKVGVFPPVASILFPKLLPIKKAFELIILGEPISAEEAKNLGLINHVFPIEDFEENIENFLNNIKKLSSVVLKHTKKAILMNLKDDFSNEIDDLEKYYLEKLMATYDANEGLNAFMEKRTPVWKNE